MEVHECVQKTRFIPPDVIPEPNVPRLFHACLERVPLATELVTLSVDASRAVPPWPWMHCAAQCTNQTRSDLAPLVIVRLHERSTEILHQARRQSSGSRRLLLLAKAAFDFSYSVSYLRFFVVDTIQMAGKSLNGYVSRPFALIRKLQTVPRSSEHDANACTVVAHRSEVDEALLFMATYQRRTASMPRPSFDTSG